MKKTDVAIKHFYIDFKVIVIVLVILLLNSCNKNKTESPIVARVGDSVLSLDQILKNIGSRSDTVFYGNELERYVFGWIDEELFYQAGVAEGFVNSPEIQDELRKVKRALIINNYLEKKLVESEEIPTKILDDYYQQHLETFVRDEEEFRYSFLICKEKTYSQTVLREIRNDSSFSGLIKRGYPEKILNNIWDSKYVPIERVVPGIQRTIKRLNPGAAYGPVASASGFIVFKLEEKYDSGTIRDFELVKEKIRRLLQEDRYREQYQQLLVSLRNMNEPEINLENAEKAIISDQRSN